MKGEYFYNKNSDSYSLSLGFMKYAALGVRAKLVESTNGQVSRPVSVNDCCLFAPPSSRSSLNFDTMLVPVFEVRLF